jgi:hypothetical protein
MIGQELRHGLVIFLGIACELLPETGLRRRGTF